VILWHVEQREELATNRMSKIFENFFMKHLWVLMGMEVSRQWN